MTGRNQHEPDRRAAPAATARPLRRNKHDRERFRARLLARLPGPDQDAVSSNDLGDYFQLDTYERSNLLWTSLDHMARLGLVERIAQPGELVRYWRRSAAGDQQVHGATDMP
jgi:hypothetical protein